jgi:molybdenum cofactor cytidylyltransferase
MGRDKALLAWPPGATGRSTFLSAMIELLRPATELVIVVAGSNADSLETIVDAAAAYMVVNRQPERGQFSSLQVGLQEVLNHGRDAAVIALVDRPPAQPGTLSSLLAAFREAYEGDQWAVVPEYGGRHGHPILIGREMMEAFLRAPATSTAREVEHALEAHILYVPVDDPNVVANINTPEDYERLAQAKVETP